MRMWVHKKATQVFLSVLAVYVLIVCTVSYVGVKVTYIVAPVLVVSGLLHLWTKPKGSAAPR